MFSALESSTLRQIYKISKIQDDFPSVYNTLVMMYEYDMSWNIMKTGECWSRYVADWLTGQRETVIHC